MKHTLIEVGIILLVIYVIIKGCEAGYIAGTY